MSDKVMNKIKNGREYRAMMVEPVEGVTDQVVEGYATTFNQPYPLYA